MPDLVPALSMAATGPALSGARSVSATVPVRILALATLVALPLVLLSVADAGGLRVLWDDLHWCLTAIAAAAATAWSVRGTTGRVRVVRVAGAAALALRLVANLTWAWLTWIQQPSVPSIADLFVFAIVVPGAMILVASTRGRTTPAEASAVYLDAALGFLLIATILILLHGEVATALPTAGGILALAYPTGFIGLGIAGLIAMSAGRYRISSNGAMALVAGSIAVGCAYLGWIAPVVNGTETGVLPSILFTVGTLLAGYGIATWDDAENEDPRIGRLTVYATRIVGPTVAGVLYLALLVPVAPAVELLVRLAVFAGGGLFVTRQALLLRERSRTLAAVQVLTEENSRLVTELRHELDHRLKDQRRLVQASRAAAVGELAAGVAHEVNNPLTGVLGFAEILIEETPPDDPRRADLETIRDEALRARDIVRALRDFASSRKPELASTDVSDLVRRSVDLLRYSIERGGVTIHEDLDELPPILIDSGAIQQAILNILTNAKQAMAEGGVLEVSVKADGDARLITITDNGVGMDDETVRLAFDPFFSGRDGDPDVEPAMGLGLSVSNGLIESHGGTIRIQSEPGRGTTVEVRIPATAVVPELDAPNEGSAA
jgi:signal transduction histidine kinase